MKEKTVEVLLKLVMKGTLQPIKELDDFEPECDNVTKTKKQKQNNVYSENINDTQTPKLPADLGQSCRKYSI